MPIKKKKILRVIYERYLQGTPKETFVVSRTVFFCYLTGIVAEQIKRIESIFNERKVYITTISLKHSYDKRPAEEFDFLLDNLHKVITYPDCIYKNRSSKRGSFCFIKNLKGDKYFCSLEFDVNKKVMFCVTSFRLKKESYLDNYELLWSWEDGTPPS